jgi:iron(III) transport system substrate-binding protein
MSLYRFLIILSILVWGLTSCAPAPGAQVTAAVATEVSTAVGSPTPASETSGDDILGKLVIYSGRSEALIQPVIDAFKTKHPHVEILLKAGSNSELANALLEEAANPVADVFITTELFTVQSLAMQDVFQSYLPAEADQLPPEFIGPNQTWIGLTRRARVIMYNSELVSAQEAPKSIFELMDAKWKGQIAAAGTTNGSMQAQIAAMRQLLGEQATEEWLKGLLANDVTFFGGHTDVRKAVGSGEFKIGLVNHYYFYLQQAEGSPVGVVFPDQGEGEIGLITNATAAGIVKGAHNLAAAQAFMDFLISPEGQNLFAELNYEYPLRAGVPLRQGVQPLDGFRLAAVDVVKAALDFEATFDLMERVGLP